MLLLMGVAAKQQSVDFITSPQVGTSNTGSPTAPNQKIRSVESQKSIRAWVPSLSKTFVQAFWWGYRLYPFPTHPRNPKRQDLRSSQTISSDNNSLNVIFQ
ncbi:hypothetical protein BYT27DRAFT_6753706 [Phlegmacium glaucopus]|nr:hypothetical protein BYT27DRAFT_6753706 [Phlegmacium glaucopus]